MELTRTDAVFSRIVMVLFLCRNRSSRNVLEIYEDFSRIKEKYLRKDPPEGACQWATSPQVAATHYGRAMQACGAHVAPPPPISALYLLFRLEKNQREGFIAFCDRRCRHILFFIWRADLESVSGSGEGKSSPSSSSTFLHRQFHDALHRS